VTNTIEDVAAGAGVSRSTASRALSGHPSVHPTTRARVQAVAAEMDYQVDAVARALRAGSSGLIGVVLTNLVNSSIQTIATTIQAHGHAAGFEALVATTENDPLRERDIVNRLRSHRVDGVIIMGVGENTAMLNALDAAGFPVVAMIRLPRGVDTAAVVYDDRRAAETATEHLLALGHREIAFLGGPASTRSGRERFAGYLRSLRAAGLAGRDDLTARGPFEPEFGFTAVHDLLVGPVRPTGLVAANHEATPAALQELGRRGISIPHELSVVAIEDADVLRYWHPAITVIDTDPELVGKLALAALLGRLRGEPDPAVGGPTVVHVRLVERASTAALPRSPRAHRIGRDPALT
jgi:LacI family transcriptional regulator